MFARFVLPIAVLSSVVILGARAQEPNCARNYTVQLGDTCDGISAKTNVSTYQLATVNKDKINALCSNLALGEPLCLGIIGQDCQITHVVQSQEPCIDIAQAAGTTLDVLFANNPNVNTECTNIYPGEVLCTADDVIVVNTPSTA